MENVLVTSGGGLRSAERAERRVALDVCMNLLRGPEREVLELVYLRQLDVDQAAAKLNISRSAANMRLVRARRSLAKKLREWTDLVG